MAHRICWRVAAITPRSLLSTRFLPNTWFSTTQTRLSCFVNSQNRYARLSTRLVVGRFSTTPPNTEDVSYEEMKKIVDGHNKAVIIDVREPWELREYGEIPGSINVPLGQINMALRLDAEEFEEKFGGKMPEHTESVIFTCLAGVRSKTALDTATSLGYKSVQHFPGGWQEWIEREQNKTP